MLEIGNSGHGDVAHDIREAAELRASLRKFLRASERVAREEGLTPSRYLLLLMIQSAEDGRSTVTELADRMQLTQSTVTELVTRAESGRPGQRSQSEDDARVFWLELTEEGRVAPGAGGRAQRRRAEPADRAAERHAA